MNANGRITAVENVPADSTYLFTLRDRESGEEDEAILTRLDGEVAGWINRCMHFTHIRLDKGSGAPKRDVHGTLSESREQTRTEGSGNGEIICANHGAYFEDDTGLCTYGPCEGAFLDGIEIEIRDGVVHLVDDDYEFVREGGIETDPADLSSKSNIEF